MPVTSKTQCVPGVAWHSGCRSCCELKSQQMARQPRAPRGGVKSICQGLCALVLHPLHGSSASRNCRVCKQVCSWRQIACTRIGAGKQVEPAHLCLQQSSSMMPYRQRMVAAWE